MWYAPSAFNFIENQTLLQVFLTLCNETNGPRSQRTQHIKKHVLKPLNKLRTNSKLLQYNDFVVHKHHFALVYKYDITEDDLFWKKQVFQSQFWWGFLFNDYSYENVHLDRISLLSSKVRAIFFRWTTAPLDFQYVKGPLQVVF